MFKCKMYAFSYILVKIYITNNLDNTYHYAKTISSFVFYSVCYSSLQQGFSLLLITNCSFGI